MTLVRAFLDRLPTELRAAAETDRELDARLGVLTRVSSARPLSSDEAASWVGWVAERMDPEQSLADAFDRLRAEDLFLAWRCAAGDAQALDDFRARYRPVMEAAVARNAPADVMEETLQRVFVRLFVAGPERPPTITKYTGRGSLEGWAVVVATREAYTMLSRDKVRDHIRPDDAGRLFDGVVDAGENPELAHLKETYRQQFKAAFQKALLELSPRDRNILRHQHVDGLDLPQIAALYGVHRATLHRWRVAARQQLFEQTRATIEAEHALSGGEFDSMMRLIESQLDVSLSRVLREDEGAGRGDAS